MKLPTMPKMPKIPKLSMDELREKLPFQSRREFVMYDSEHPDDGTDMEYHPSTGYPAPGTGSRPQPGMSVQENGYDPFQRNTVYPGGQERVPYAAGGPVRSPSGGTWPPEPTYSAAAPREFRNPQTPPLRPTAAREEYAPSYGYVQPQYEAYQTYKPRVDHSRPEYSQPSQGGYAPYGYPPRGAYGQVNYAQANYTQVNYSQAGYAPSGYGPVPGYDSSQPAPGPRTAPPARSQRPKPGLGVRIAAAAGALLPKRSPKRAVQDNRSRPKNTDTRAQGGTYAQASPYAPPRPPQPARQSLRPGELKYYIWSGSIVAGLLLTVISFIYACAA